MFNYISIVFYYNYVSRMSLSSSSPPSLISRISHPSRRYRRLETKRGKGRGRPQSRRTGLASCRTSRPRGYLLSSFRIGILERCKTCTRISGKGLVLGVPVLHVNTKRINRAKTWNNELLFSSSRRLSIVSNLLESLLEISNLLESKFESLLE
jgi:hypothetical protein